MSFALVQQNEKKQRQKDVKLNVIQVNPQQNIVTGFYFIENIISPLVRGPG